MPNTNFEKTIRIPIITDLVMAGNPDLKIKVNTSMEGVEGDKQAFDLRLKEKINELKETIGQEEGNNIGRAHAIRAEASGAQRGISDTHHEKNMDRDRAEIMKKLSRDNE